MEKINQTQKAGNDSQQFMANTLIVNNGLTEQQIRSIIDQEIKNTLKENQLVANDVAQERLDNFENVLIPKLVKSEMLDLFKEPAVQMLFKTAQKTAIGSGRKLDYELLSELLIQRTNKNNLNKNVAISNAIEIIDKLTEEALMVLTIFFAVTRLAPINGNINEGFNILNDLFGKILQETKLPNNDEWIENLEINRIITINTLGSSENLDDYWFENFTSYSQIWIKKDSDELYEIYKKLSESNIPTDIIIDNPLDSNFKTLKILQKNQIQNIIIPLKDNQKDIIKNIFDDNRFKNNGYNNEKELFKKKLEQFSNLNYINEWWNKNVAKYYIRMNSIGKVIAYTNIKNIDPTLPNLD